jgi:hypothetical protein
MAAKGSTLETVQKLLEGAKKEQISREKNN